MRKLRIAVIGAGMAFEPHARSLLDMRSELEVACVVARSASGRESVQTRYGFPVAASPDAIWHDVSIDAVLVLTPPNTHADLVLPAARAGKHILLEKPLDASFAQARAIVETCAQHQVHLGIVFQHRYRESSIALYDALRGGKLGDIVSVSIQVPWWRPQSYYDVPGRGTMERDGGGVLLTQAIHTIDLALSFAGPVESVFSYVQTSPVHQMETEDVVTAVLKFCSGAIGSLHATTACYPGFAEQIRISGTKGSASLEGDSLQLRWMDGTQRDIGTATVLGGGADPMAFSHTHHLALLRSFCAAIRTGTASFPQGRAALHVQSVIEAILQSGREGRPVNLPAA